jgi:hypothetical protein
MIDLREIKHVIRQLSPEDLAEFRAWFAEFDAQVWDRQLEEDVAAGRLDSLADEALQDVSRRITPRAETDAPPRQG